MSEVFLEPPTFSRKYTYLDYLETKPSRLMRCSKHNLELCINLVGFFEPTWFSKKLIYLDCLETKP